MSAQGYGVYDKLLNCIVGNCYVMKNLISVGEEKLLH
jgi:hypothetical protein